MIQGLVANYEDRMIYSPRSTVYGASVQEVD